MKVPATTHRPLALENEEFLRSDDARPLRILAEYLDPLATFRRERIHDTVVFFGSARISPDGPLGRYYEDARELARLVTGSVAGAIFFQIGKYLMAYYLSTAAVVSAYGAAGSLVVILMWIYFSSGVLLLAASIARAWADEAAARATQLAKLTDK